MTGRGRVPTFDGPNGDNFTETFDIARTGRRAKPNRDATTTNPPPSRRLPQRPRPSAVGAPAPSQRRSKPIPVSDGGVYGDSHIPTFGTWNVDGDQNYTGIFQAASRAKKGEVVGGPGILETASDGRGIGGSGDLYKPRQSKKRRSSWCCFRA